MNLRVFPQWNIGLHHQLFGERCIHEVHRIPTVLAVAYGFSHQRCHFLNLLLGQGCCGGFAFFVGGGQVVKHHGRAQALDHAGTRFHHLDGFVHLVVGDGLFAHVACTLRAACGLQGLGLAVDRRGRRHRRLVGGSSWHTRRLAGRAAVGFHHLLAAYDTGVLSLVGAVLLRGLFGLRKIHLSRHLRFDVVAPHHRLQYVHDAAGVQRLYLLHIGQLLRVSAGAATQAFCWGRQQFAAVVQHAHGCRAELGHARRHQMHNACQLGAV